MAAHISFPQRLKSKQTTRLRLGSSVPSFSSVQGDTLVRLLLVLIGAGFVWASAVCVSAQTAGREPVASPNPRKAEQSPVIDSIEFVGLRHISSAAVEAQLSLRLGERFDASKLRRDLHTLGRLGWFSSIRVEELSQAEPQSQASLSGQIMA